MYEFAQVSMNSKRKLIKCLRSEDHPELLGNKSESGLWVYQNFERIGFGYCGEMPCIRKKSKNKILLIVYVKKIGTLKLL